jgi:FkbM family methyltransferase
MSQIEHWLAPYLPEDGRLALDVGANEGAYTAWLADRFEQVHAFDPNPQTLGALRRQVCDRGNVRLIETAVSNESGFMRINLYPCSEHASAYTDMGLDTGSRGGVVDTITVPAVALDDLGYQDQPVDFAKIDTEGAEAAILAGAFETLEANRPRCIVEVHSFDNIEGCRSIFHRAGYTDVQHLPHPHSGVHPGHCWLIANG